MESDSLIFEVFELVEEDPPQLWRTVNGAPEDVPLTALEGRFLVFLAQRPKRWVSVEVLI